MRMVPVSDFLPTLRPMVDAPLPLQMKQAVLKSAIRFCRESGVVITSRHFCQVYEGQTINVVKDSAVNRNAGGALKASSKSVVSVDGVELSADVDYHALSLDDVFFLRDHRDVTIACTVEPVSSAKEVPAKLYDDWLDGICAGAAAWLYALPQFLNGDLHAHYEREFVEAMRNATRWRLESSPAMSPRRANRKREFYS